MIDIILSYISIAIYAIVYLIYLIAFFFWFSYLLRIIHRKWHFYKVTRVDSNNDSNYLAYKLNTEFVHYVFLFVINIVEGMANTLKFLTLPVYLVDAYGDSNRDTQWGSENETLTVRQNFRFFEYGLNPSLVLNADRATTNLFVLTIALTTSLCVYLSARYARKSWITSNSIRYYLGITIIILVILQASALTHWISSIITRIVHWVLEVVLFILLVKRTKRLRMVVNWTIVDLSLSLNQHRQVNRLRRMERRFVWYLYLLLIGYFLLVMADFAYTVCLVMIGFFKISSFSNLSLILDRIDLSFLQDNTALARAYPIIKFVISLFYNLGIGFLVLPYVIPAFYTLAIMLWRCVRGKTGYQTHFPNHKT